MYALFSSKAADKIYYYQVGTKGVVAPVDGVVSGGLYVNVGCIIVIRLASLHKSCVL